MAHLGHFLGCFATLILSEHHCFSLPWILRHCWGLVLLLSWNTSVPAVLDWAVCFFNSHLSFSLGGSLFSNIPPSLLDFLLHGFIDLPLFLWPRVGHSPFSWKGCVDKHLFLCKSLYMADSINISWGQSFQSSLSKSIQQLVTIYPTLLNCQVLSLNYLIKYWQHYHGANIIFFYSICEKTDSEKLINLAGPFI